MTDNRLRYPLWTIAVAVVVFVLLCVVKSCSGAAPLEVVFAALQDAGSLSPEIRPWTRYVYVPDGKAESRGAISFAINAAIYSSAQVFSPTVPDEKTPYPGVAVIGDNLLRLNFYEGGGSLKTWERLWPDPFFNVAFGGVVRKEITVPAYTASDGKTYTRKIVEQRLIFPQHVLPHAQPLADLLGTNIPIVEASYLIVRALSTVDQGYGDGLYYEFAGVRKSNNKNQTDEELFYADFGIDVKRARKNLVVSRAAILNRELNSKLSAVEIVQGEGHPATTDGKIYATFDLQDKDADVGRDPIENLLGFVDNAQHRASEVIAPRRNGLHLFALFNNQGALQTEVPPDVAVWSGVPSGHTNRLIPGIACLHCHTQGKEMGIRTFVNDARDLPVLFDFADKNSRERLRSEYGYDLQRSILESRAYYADAAFLASGGMQLDKIGAAEFGLWSTLLYESVDAQVALQRIGVAAVSVQEAGIKLAAIKTSNPYIQSLVIGKKIGGKQFARVLPDIALHFKKEIP